MASNSASASLSLLPSAWRRFVPFVGEEEIWDRLNDEFISYRHTEWSENVATLCRLGGALASLRSRRTQVAWNVPSVMPWGSPPRSWAASPT